MEQKEARMATPASAGAEKAAAADDAATLDWLLAGDPAIRWQALRDLQGAPADEWRAERRRTLNEGWGACLLAL
jgi:hypothetical protein